MFWIIVSAGAIVIAVIAVIVSRHQKAADADNKRKVEQGKLLMKEIQSQAAAGDAAAAKKLADYVNHFDEGVALFNQNDYKSAAQCFCKAIEVIPFGDAAAYNNLGLCQQYIPKMMNEAYLSLSTAVMIDPNNTLYRENFLACKNRTLYLVFMGIAKILLCGVGPVIAAFVGGKIGIDNDEFIRRLSSGIKVGAGTTIRMVLGSAIGGSAAGILGGLLFVFLGRIGNKKFGLDFGGKKHGKDDFGINRLFEMGYDATDENEPLVKSYDDDPDENEPRRENPENPGKENSAAATTGGQAADKAEEERIARYNQERDRILAMTAEELSRVVAEQDAKDAQAERRRKAEAARKMSARVGHLLQLALTGIYFYVLFKTDLLDKIDSIKMMLVFAGALSLVFGLISLFCRENNPRFGCFFLLAIDVVTVISLSKGGYGIFATILTIIVMFIMLLLPAIPGIILMYKAVGIADKRIEKIANAEVK